jgi:hypothetical protein
MIVNLLTDAPKPNLALMKISAYHKALGDTVSVMVPDGKPDLTYGSWLFSQSYFSDIAGGPGVDPAICLPSEIEAMRPDYSLYPKIDYSIGYTWRWCPRHCDFCIVPRQNNERVHRSIWDFHDTQFKKICLMNNNTFSDPQWLDTFHEIWDAGLTVHDENGYDLRLMDEGKAEALKRTKFDGSIHFAWDLMKDETHIVEGLKLSRKYKLKAMVYVLIGYNTTREEDLYRCQIIHDHGLDPYPMPFNRGNKSDRAFKRFICLRGYRKYKTIKEAWLNYKGMI